MSLQELLEKDRERLLASLKQAGTPERAVPVMEAEYDRLLYTYNEQCSDVYEQETASRLLQTARMAAPSIDCIGETQIWTQSGKPAIDGGKKVRGAALILLIAGIVLLIASALVLAGVDTALNQVFARPAIAAALLLGILFVFLAGLFLRRSTPQGTDEKQLKTEARIDAEKLYRSMHAVLMTADRNITDALSARRMEEEQRSQNTAEDKTDLALYSDLLEASLARDGEYALDQVSKVPFYLHQKGIETLEYSDEYRSYFDVIPGEKKETIRPALVRDGHLLKKGIVSGDF